MLLGLCGIKRWYGVGGVESEKINVEITERAESEEEYEQEGKYEKWTRKSWKEGKNEGWWWDWTWANGRTKQYFIKNIPQKPPTLVPDAQLTSTMIHPFFLYSYFHILSYYNCVRSTHGHSHGRTLSLRLHPPRNPEQPLHRSLYPISHSVGPKIIKLRHIINTFKGLTFAWVLFLMYSYNNYSTGMYLYLVLHGSYGMFWVLKDIFFPDSRWERKASVGSAIATFLFLTLYWFIPVPLAAGLGVSHPSNARILFLLGIYITGLILMLGSDYQKYHALKKKPGILWFNLGLISTGFFKTTRNPNYLG